MNKLKVILINDGTTNIYKGLVEKSYFKEKIINKNLNIKDFEIENVIGDGNCGFGALSLHIPILPDFRHPINITPYGIKSLKFHKLL